MLKGVLYVLDTHASVICFLKKNKSKLLIKNISLKNIQSFQSLRTTNFSIGLGCLQTITPISFYPFFIDAFPHITSLELAPVQAM
jgi:hypothetical protein